MENQLHIPIKQLEERFKSILIRLPIMAGNEALNFFLDNFKRQGFLGSSLQPWPKRKNPTKWGMTPKRNGRALLVDTGMLRRSIRIVSITNTTVIIGTDVPYARVHNEGLRLGEIQSVKAYTRKVNYRDETSAPGARKLKFTKVQVGSVNVKAHKRKINQKIPARRFMGNSPYLEAKIKRVITAEIMKALRP